MDITILPGKLSGSIPAIPSKSQAHRLLICAAFGDSPTTLHCPQTNQDIEATADCLRALGAEIVRLPDGYSVTPISHVPKTALLPCRESGSTLRFLLPVVGALGADVVFELSGRLPQRPLSPLWEEMERMGCRLSRPTESTVRCEGKLLPGDYTISGSVSSQFVTGLLFALSKLDGSSRLTLTGKVESLPYIHMTLEALKTFGIEIPEENRRYEITPRLFHSPGHIRVEGDWSNAAFWLAARALGSGLNVTGLNYASAQGDRAVMECLEALEEGATIDAAQIPDLVPILAVTAGAKKGATFINAGRLRIKESDRLETTAMLIRNLGGEARVDGDSLTVMATGYRGGIMDACGDHRIAMATAIAATVCTGPVTVQNAQQVCKSYPAFWDDYKMLGGKLT